jgi:putative acyl-CoA dehydrogenase
MEVLGGNGYVEEFILARIYRETPVNSIWEGSGNVMCLDVLRALSRSPKALDAVMEEVAEAARGEPRLKAFVARLKLRAGDESQARVLVRDLVLAVSAALLIRHAPNTVSAAFIASRLGDGPETFGMLAAGVDCRSILSRAAANPS